MREKAIVSWSGGKDSALALYEVAAEYDIVSLLTTVTSGYDRISMHGVRTVLLEQQAAALGYPLEQVSISPRCGNDEYESGMRAALDRHRAASVSRVICGDIFLEDVRALPRGAAVPRWTDGRIPTVAARQRRIGPSVHPSGFPRRAVLRRYAGPR